MKELKLLFLCLLEPIFSRTPAQNTSIYQSSLVEEFPKIAKYLGNSPQNSRVVNGDRVTYNNEAPYYVRLMFCTSNNMCGHCGGSWISQRQIISAAHCVPDDVDRIYYFKNTNNERRDDSSYSGIATGHVIHPDWNGIHGDGKDIAIVRTANSIFLPVQPIKLATMSDFEKLNTNVDLTVYGFGQTSSNPASGVEGSLYLRKSKPLQFLNCNHLATKGIYYPQYEGGVTYTFPTTEYGIVCIENTDNSDMCTGDSGGPLIFNRKLYGLNSYFWGSCGQFPSVSTSVAHYYDWIVANSDYRPNQGNIWDDAVTVPWPTENPVGTTEEVTTVYNFPEMVPVPTTQTETQDPTTAIEDNFYFEESDRNRRLRLKKEARDRFLIQKQEDRTRKSTKRQQMLQIYRDDAKSLREHNKFVFRKRREWEILNHLVTRFGIREKSTRCVPKSILNFSWLDMTSSVNGPLISNVASSGLQDTNEKITSLFLGLPEKYQGYYYVIAHDEDKQLFQLQVDNEGFLGEVLESGVKKFKNSGYRIQPGEQLWNGESVDLQIKHFSDSNKVDVDWYYCCTDSKCVLPTVDDK